MVACILFTHSAVAQVGNSGMSFLKLGVSGRGVSMADAMSANVSGAAATFYNPAGIFHEEGSGKPAELLFMHKEWIQDTRTEFLGASLSLDDENAVGISMNSTTVADIEIRTRPGNAEGTFTARNYALGVSYARQLSDALRVGLTAKFLYEKIFIEEASGYAFDFGIQLKTPVEALSVGAVVSNLGRMNALHNERTTLPVLIRIGPVYSMEVASLSSTLTLASDMLYIFPEKQSYENLGGEFMYNQVVAARTGYQFGSKGRGFTAGFGVRYEMFQLDYAYAPLSLDLGNSHTFSLSLSL